VRSVQEEVYIEDRPATDRPLIWENFKWPYLREGSSDPLFGSTVGFSRYADRMALISV